MTVIKTRVQQDHRIEPVASTSKATMDTSPIAKQVKRGTGAKIVSTAKEVIRIDGVKGLWRGTTPTLLRSAFLSQSLTREDD